MELQGRVAVITGASSGIGKAVARDLSEAGMKLILTGQREDKLRDLCAELGDAEWIAGDIADPAMPQKLIDMAMESFGRCDVVFNNAGFMTVGTIEEIDVDRVCQMVRVNVEAAYRMIYVALQHFKKTGDGYLVNTSSILGTKVRDTTGAYAGTKWAIEALTESLRIELGGTNIGICAVEPGLVQTELHREWPVHPSKSLGIEPPLEPEDIARAVRFVLEQPDHVRIPRILVTPAAQKM
jgi:NADP-dependent 3-hydroxy acid dehydrogenase YdfG